MPFNACDPCKTFSSSYEINSIGNRYLKANAGLFTALSCNNMCLPQVC